MHYESKSQIVIQNGPPLACTQSFNLCATHLLNYGIHQLESLQLPSEETTLNFQYWDVSWKPSPEAWTTICSPRGLDLQKANLKWRWSSEHLSHAAAGLSMPCVLGLSPAGISSSVHGRGCCKKRHPNIESLEQFLRKAATDFSVVLHTLYTRIIHAP